MNEETLEGFELEYPKYTTTNDYEVLQDAQNLDELEVLCGKSF